MRLHYSSARLRPFVPTMATGSWPNQSCARTGARDSVLAALDWVVRSMDSSPLGFVEFRRRNPDGIPFQVWKDSGTSYIHIDGGIANWDAPIAAVEVQGYTYDALLGAARLFANPVWRDRAEALRQRVIEQFWMRGEEFFAMGLDRDGEGRVRWIDSIASNGALMLDTAIFDGLSDAERYVAAIVRRICGHDFVTEVGIRCRAASEAGLVDFQDYHGEWTVWMKETFDVARGLERQGLARLAQQLGNRLINAVNVAGAHVEFLYVSPDLRVMYDFRGSAPRTSQPEEIAGTNRPEAPITWTVVAALALKSWLGSGHGPDGFESAVVDGPGWREALETEVLQRMPPIQVLRTSAEIARAYERRGDFILNHGLGLQRDERARARRRGSEPLLPAD